MKTESPFKDRPGFLTFEEFYLLPIGTPVETVFEDGFIFKWKREAISEDKKSGILVSGFYHHGEICLVTTGAFLCDHGILPHPSGEWSSCAYTRLPLQKPQPPSELDKLRQELKAARDTVERLAVQIEEMSK